MSNGTDHEFHDELDELSEATDGMGVCGASGKKDAFWRRRSDVGFRKGIRYMCVYYTSLKKPNTLEGVHINVSQYHNIPQGKKRTDLQIPQDLTQGVLWY